MLIVAATLAVFAYGLMSPLLGALLPAYALTPAQEGTLTLVNALGLVVASLSAGPMVDIKGHKPTLLLGQGLVILALLGAPNSGVFSGLLIVYFVLGLGGGIVVTSANALVSAVDPARRGPALNFLNLFFGLGGIVTTYIAGEHISPDLLCYAIALSTGVALLVNAGTSMPSPPGEASFRLNEVPRLLAQPSLLLLALFLFLYVACEVGVWNWLTKYLVTVKFDRAAAGHVVSYGFAFGILLGRTVASRLLDKVSALQVLMAAGVLMTVTTYAMVSLRSTTAVTFAVFCSGVSMAPVFPTVLALVGDQFIRGTATAMGIVITCGWLGLAVSSPVIGMLAQGGRYGRALLLLPIFSSLMVLVNLMLRPVLRKPVAA